MCINKSDQIIKWLRQLQNQEKLLPDVLNEFGEELSKWSIENFYSGKALGEFFKNKKAIQYFDTIPFLMAKYLEKPIDLYIPIFTNEIENKIQFWLEKQLILKKDNLCLPLKYILLKCLEGIAEYDLMNKYSNIFLINSKNYHLYEITWYKIFPHLDKNQLNKSLSNRSRQSYECRLSLSIN